MINEPPRPSVPRSQGPKGSTREAAYGGVVAKRISVRPATVSDARGIAEVHVAAWRGAYEAIVPAEVPARQSVARRQSWWEEVLAPDADRGSAVDVALVDEVIAGFCAAGLSRDDDAALGVDELHALYVHPSQWGRGAGSALLDHDEQRLSSGQLHPVNDAATCSSVATIPAACQTAT